MADKLEHIQENENQTQFPDTAASPMERAMAEMERLLNEPTEDIPSKKVKESHLPPDTKLYTDEMGRNHAIDEIQAQGGFFNKPTRRHVTAVALGLTLPSVLVTVFVIALLNLMLIRAPKEATGIIIFIRIIEGLVTLSVALTVLYHCITKTRGKLYQYKADGCGFYVTTKYWDKVAGVREMIVHKEQIFYKDVLGVAYTPTTRLRGKYGYKVEIILTYGTVRFDYIFPNFNHSIPQKDLPFDIIKRNIPKQDDTE